MGKATTMRYIILAIITAAPIMAFAADPNARMEAVGACPNCEMQSAGSAFGASALRAIPVSTTRTVASSSMNFLPNLQNLGFQIGRVETVKEITDENGNTGIGEGNGIVVSPCMVITNHHQIYGADLNPDSKIDRPVGFFFGHGTGAFKWQVGGKPIHAGNRTMAGGRDYALVELTKCAGKKVGYPELDLRSPQQLAGEELMLVGISPDVKDGRLANPVQCSAKGRDPLTGALLTDCPGTNGLSAAGLFTRGGRLVAILVGKNPSGVIAIPMAEIMADPLARALVQADKAKFEAERGAIAQASNQGVFAKGSPASL